MLDAGRCLLRRAEIDLLGCPVPQHRERIEEAVATIVGLVHLGEHVGDVPGRVAERIVVLLIPLRCSPVGEGSAVGGVERLSLVGVDIGVVPRPADHIVDLAEPLEIRTDTETARRIGRVDRHRDAGSGFRPLRGIASTGVHGGTLGRPAPPNPSMQDCAHDDLPPRLPRCSRPPWRRRNGNGVRRMVHGRNRNRW